jgi:predicted HAD superfamily Cof-like phosphohydrolase
MSALFAFDIQQMHQKFGFYPVIENLTDSQLKEFLEFRIKFLEEEMAEIRKAFEEKDWDGVVDGLTDLNVVSIGTLDLFNIDIVEAWNRVHNANMAKERGVKKERPNKFGFPDLIKPNLWSPPNHSDNIGLLALIKDEKDSS